MRLNRLDARSEALWRPSSTMSKFSFRPKFGVKRWKFAYFRKRLCQLQPRCRQELLFRKYSWSPDQRTAANVSGGHSNHLRKAWLSCWLERSVRAAVYEPPINPRVPIRQCVTHHFASHLTPNSGINTTSCLEKSCLLPTILKDWN